MSITQGRYFVKFTVKGVEGHFWTDVRIWNPGKKSLKQIFELVLDQAQSDAKDRLKKLVPLNSIDIETFNLIEGITKIEITK